MTSDEELIKDWKSTRNLSSYTQLKNRHKGMVFQSVNTYSAASIPRASLEAEAWTLFDDAVENFKDSAGAKFSTYLNFQLRKLDRHTKKYQNIARIPEALAGKIGDYERANLELSQKLQRQPTHKELAVSMGMPVKHIQQIHKSLRSDLFEGKFEGQQQENPLQAKHDQWLLEELREELQGQEQEVYDYLIGYKKRKITNKKELAAKLNMSPGRISQITGNIAKKLEPHLKKHL